jgi:tetratricopeptide (TPR) repeat protein
MKAIPAAIAALVAVGFIVIMFVWAGNEGGSAKARPAKGANSVAPTLAPSKPAAITAAAVTSALAPVISPEASPPLGTATNAQLERRIAVLETRVASLQEALDGVDLEKASKDRQALFAGDEGYLKADEYFEAGKYAIAGEGYLTFVQSHPGHADTREVMKKARDAFLKAGYKDKAFWVHEEMMKGFPQHQQADVWEQARLEKEAGLYDRAVKHAAQAAELAPNPEERLWRRLYWAWYVQLRDGSAAGITALQQVQQEIAASGVKNPKLTEHAAQRMQEWQMQARRP